MADNEMHIRKLEADLWMSADILRAGSKLTSNQCCSISGLALLFFRYAYSHSKEVGAELLNNCPNSGHVMSIEPSGFAAKSALFLPREAQFDCFDYPLGEAVNHANISQGTKRTTDRYLAYLNGHGRADFIMASSSTDSDNKDHGIHKKFVLTRAVDVMVSESIKVKSKQ